MSENLKFTLAIVAISIAYIAIFSTAVYFYFR
jgi:hypothetical protein